MMKTMQLLQEATTGGKSSSTASTTSGSTPRGQKSPRSTTSVALHVRLGALNKIGHFLQTINEDMQVGKFPEALGPALARAQGCAAELTRNLQVTTCLPQNYIADEEHLTMVANNLAALLEVLPLLLPAVDAGHLFLLEGFEEHALILVDLAEDVTGFQQTRLEEAIERTVEVACSRMNTTWGTPKPEKFGERASILVHAMDAKLLAHSPEL